MASDYQHGKMEVTGHGKTYSGFMTGSIWGAGLIILICLFPILIFGVQMGWFGALMVTTIVGLIYGLVLRMKGGWFAAVIGLAIFGAILSTIISILS